ncbi:MAG: hypothetical protein L5656_10905 [Thermanaeromonas sp.]|uniref:hypothetical protein n=1 Tax=Thermanaeromonas sp. TaxID=2003697 RepID=UPI002439A2FF|nr:hypothetical protein [Thermanaeromonas sp.]MCG0279011.1 hypothetical protein [Thermanaeromonas sp.]
MCMSDAKRIEQETVILWNEAEADATVYTASPLVKARLLKAGLKPEREKGSGAWFRVPRKAVRLRVGRATVYIAGGQKQKA